MKRKTNRKGSCQLVSFVLQTDSLHLKIRKMDERACMSEQLNWNKFTFYGDKLSGKIFLGD